MKIAIKAQDPELSIFFEFASACCRNSLSALSKPLIIASSTSFGKLLLPTIYKNKNNKKCVLMQVVPQKICTRTTSMSII